MSKTLDEIQNEVGAWGDATFPQSTPRTVINHFEEEVGEFIDAHLGITGEPHTFPSDAAEEAADCFLLLLQYAHKRGFSLHEAAEAKMIKNRTRTWKTTPEPGGHVKHEAAS